MRRYPYLLLSLLCACLLNLPAEGGSWANPAIKNGGSIRLLPNAALQPDRNQTYKVLFDVDEKAADPKTLNDALDHVAGAVNIWVSAGVPLDHLKFAVIVHGPAMPLVLTDAAYEKRFDTDNPDLKLVHELKAAGVQLYVCGEAMAGQDYDDSEVDPAFTVALSGMSTLAILQEQGYALVPL